MRFNISMLHKTDYYLELATLSILGISIRCWKKDEKKDGGSRACVLLDFLLITINYR